MGSFQYPGRGLHPGKVQLFPRPPYIGLQERGCLPFFGKKVSVGFSEISAAHGEIHIHLPAGGDADSIGQAGIHGINELVSGNGGIRIKRTLLPVGMDTGICAGYEVEGRLLPGQFHDAVFHHFLHRHPVLLALEATIDGTIIG